MKKSSKYSINWAQPDISQDDFDSLKSCFDSKWISQGKKVAQFEKYVATLSNRKYCIAVNSGSSALMSLLISLNISHKSEVVIPAMSFIALPHIVTLLGAIPVLADIDKDTGMISPKTLLPCISKKTAAVIGIDYSGFANDWTDLHNICSDLGIFLIIDSASSFLSTNNRRPAGSFGDAAIFSFHTAKVITTGEGGAIVTDNKKLALLLKEIRNHGEVRGEKYLYNSLGSNFRMTDIAASLGISQIIRKEKILKHRHELISYYLSHRKIRELALAPYKDKNLVSNGFAFTILSDSRNKVKEELFKHVIETRVMWPYCVDRQPIYKKHIIKKIGAYLNAKYFSQSCLSLPLHTGLENDEINNIVSIIEKSIS